MSALQALASDAMAIIGTSLGMPHHEVDKYKSTAALLQDVRLLDSLHWDEANGMYLDYGYHTEGVSLQKHAYMVNGQQQVGAVCSHSIKAWLQPSFYKDRNVMAA